MKLKLCTCLVILVAFSGCSTTNTLPSLSEVLETKKIQSEPQRLAAAGIQFLEDGDLKEALHSFNKALKLAPRNSVLNFFAGLVYHLSALRGDETQIDLAKQGYQRAVQADPSNWVAHYHAGLLELDLRKYKDAQSSFAQALIYNSEDPDVLYSMIVASYYTGDMTLVDSLLNQLGQFEPESDRYLKAAAIVKAALNEQNAAEEFIEKLEATDAGERTKKSLIRRLKDWKTFYQRHSKKLDVNAQFSKQNSEQAPYWQNNVGIGPKGMPVPKVEVSALPDQEEEIITTEETEKDENQMVIVDVVIIRTEEDSSTSQGINLLNNLTIELGSSNQSSSGFSVSDSRAKTVGNFTRTITKALNIPSITYSLNIANTANSRNEILARPTLTATNGEQSDFFSGVTIKAQTLPSTSGGTGESVSIEQDVGVKLGITPNLQDDGRVKLAVNAERTFLNTPNSNIVGYTSKVETSRTTVNATVVLNFGETLILSGLSEKETERTRDQTPVLGEVPVLQYFFNKRTTTNFNKSVLLLITPRLPEYLYRPAHIASGSSSPPNSNDALSEFRSRYSDWFKPYPSWASIFHQMQDNSLYREFRTGDVTMERWDNGDKYMSRLRQMLDFLYY